MARLGTLRVNDILDYEQDIKGKRLIRLRAGVGAGKNYWANFLKVLIGIQTNEYFGCLRGTDTFRPMNVFC